VLQNPSQPVPKAPPSRGAQYGDTTTIQIGLILTPKSQRLAAFMDGETTIYEHRVLPSA